MTTTDIVESLCTVCSEYGVST